MNEISVNGGKRVKHIIYFTINTHYNYQSHFVMTLGSNKTPKTRGH